MGKSKQKTRKVVTKRFKVTKKGKLKRKHSATSHLGRKNGADRKNRKKTDREVSKGFTKKIKSMIVQ